MSDLDSIYTALLVHEAIASACLDRDRDGRTWAMEDDEREDT